MSIEPIAHGHDATEANMDSGPPTKRVMIWWLRWIYVSAIALAAYLTLFMVNAKVFSGTRVSYVTEPEVLVYFDGSSSARNALGYYAFWPLLQLGRCTGRLGFIDDAQGFPNDQMSLLGFLLREQTNRADDDR